MNVSRMLVVIIVFFGCGIINIGIKIEFQERIVFSNKVLLRLPVSICVTQDNVIIIPDYKGGDIKIYKSKGELANVVGKKGYGPNEFLAPWSSTFKQNTFVVADLQQRKFFFYNRKGKYSFHRVNEIFCNGVGVDMDYVENKLYLSGSKTDKKGNLYSFYSLEIGSERRYTYILPSHVKYGFSSSTEVQNEIFNNRELTTIGVKGMFDIKGDYAFYAWEGDCRILKINLKNKEIVSFGKNPKNYVRPYATKKLIMDFFSRKGKDVIKERQKMTYLLNLFTTENHLVVIFRGPGKSGGEAYSIFQFYTFDGKYVDEVTIQNMIGNSIWFDRQQGLLYSIAYDFDEDQEEKYYAAKYRVSD